MIKLSHTRFTYLGPVVAVVAIFGCFEQARSSAVPTTQSIEDASPLPADPSNVVGQFPNGLHYVIRHNANPPGNIYVGPAVPNGSPAPSL